MIAGIDEAGRGPLVGPVTAACVILPSDFDTSILKDSKKMSEKKRYQVAPLIKEKAVAWSFCHIDHTVIDRINILEATLLAMKTAFETLHDNSGNPVSILNLPVSELVVDGTFLPHFESEILSSIGKVDCHPLVKADSKVASVMAASIIAKTERDLLMKEYAEKYPEYEYEKNKGYATKRHYELIAKYGVSPIQRKSFSLKKLDEL
ncbi:MAG: ribonuclease HII [Treponemataceae bacterium]|nr:ribonuclease HII [Treponemataceae bacterium]